MSARTVFLARLFGLYCLVMGAAMLLQRDAFPAMVSAITANAPLVLTMAVFTLFGGLAMVLLHNIWSGGALPIIITLLGWLTLIKSVMLLFLPPATFGAVRRRFRKRLPDFRRSNAPARGLSHGGWFQD